MDVQLVNRLLTPEEAFAQPKRRGRPPKAKVEKLQISGDLPSFLRYQSLRLEHAMTLKAGVMASDSKHLEIANNIRALVLSVIDDLRAKADAGAENRQTG